MKKVALFFMILSMGLIIWFFIKEQFKGIILSPKENIVISITYLVLGISTLIFARVKFLEKKKEGN